jgi:hypothetical protein
MAKKKDYSRFLSGSINLKSNYQVKLWIGKESSNILCDGKGIANDKKDAEKMFDSLVKKTHGLINAELYFENVLIKKL